jgi:hypothetical protein
MSTRPKRKPGYTCRVAALRGAALKLRLICVRRRHDPPKVTDDNDDDDVVLIIEADSCITRGCEWVSPSSCGRSGSTALHTSPWSHRSNCVPPTYPHKHPAAARPTVSNFLFTTILRISPIFRNRNMLGSGPGRRRQLTADCCGVANLSRGDPPGVSDVAATETIIAVLRAEFRQDRRR